MQRILAVSPPEVSECKYDTESGHSGDRAYVRVEWQDELVLFENSNGYDIRFQDSKGRLVPGLEHDHIPKDEECSAYNLEKCCAKFTHFIVCNWEVNPKYFDSSQKYYFQVQRDENGHDNNWSNEGSCVFPSSGTAIPTPAPPELGIKRLRLHRVVVGLSSILVLLGSILCASCFYDHRVPKVNLEADASGAEEEEEEEEESEEEAVEAEEEEEEEEGGEEEEEGEGWGR
jgi:hypothetical protein